MNEFILQVLDIIDYQNDKQAFANKFIELAHMQAIDMLIHSLPEEKRTELVRKFTDLKSAETMKKMMHDCFTQEEFENALDESLEKLFSEYLQTIYPTLTEDQITSLQFFFKSQEN